MQDIKSQYDDVLTFWKTIKELNVVDEIDFEKICDKIETMSDEMDLDDRRLLMHLNVAFLKWCEANNKK